MPASTRSTTRTLAAVTPANNNKKWSTQDQRSLIRMCRQTEMTPDTMAAVLGRSEEAIRYRLAKIIHEHLDGRKDDASIREVSNWLLPN
jgi:predicted HTH transcriptional regulator